MWLSPERLVRARRERNGDFARACTPLSGRAVRTLAARGSASSAGTRARQLALVVRVVAVVFDGGRLCFVSRCFGAGLVCFGGAWGRAGEEAGGNGEVVEGLGGRGGAAVRAVVFEDGGGLGRAVVRRGRGNGGKRVEERVDKCLFELDEFANVAANT